MLFSIVLRLTTGGTYRTLKMSSIEYFRAGEEHLDTLINCRIAFLSEHFGEQPEESVNELKLHLRQYFTEALNKKYVCWLAKDGEEVVGIGGMTIREHPGSFRNPGGTMGYIMNMYTVPAYRRKGISSAILHKLVESGREMGIGMFELQATQLGEPVYRKYGFKLHGEPTYRLRLS